MTQEQIKQIQDLCWQRINAIEESSSYGSVPHYSMDLYGLYFFIMTRSFQRYVQQFELQTVDINNITQAKSYYNWPPVSTFEKDVASLLNQMVEGKMKKDRELGSFVPVVLNNHDPMRINSVGERQA